MAEKQDNPAPPARSDRAESSAEKAYAAAAGAIALNSKSEETPMPETETTELAQPTMDAADPVVETPPAEPAPAAIVAEPKRRGRPPAVRATEGAVAQPAPVKTRKTPDKRASAKPVAPKVPVAKIAKPAKIAAPKTALAKPKPAIKPAVRKAAISAAPAKPQLKERTMEMKSKIESVMTEAQEKAKAAFEKGTELLGEAGEFTKGNVEAMVESGKILATGLQDMGTTMVADTKESFETMTADVKAMAAVKSPTELVKLQGDIMRRNLDKAVAYSSKNSEAMLKLANDVFAPISGRFSLAMDKVRKAA